MCQIVTAILQDVYSPRVDPENAIQMEMLLSLQAAVLTGASASEFIALLQAQRLFLQVHGWD